MLVLFLIIYSCFSFSCEEVESLYDSSITGQRRVQHDSNMCYAFSISHALSAITGSYVNPIDIAYQFKKHTGNGHAINTVDFQLGANPNLYNDDFVRLLISQGLCKTVVSNDSLDLLRNEDISDKITEMTNCSYGDLSGIEQFRVIQQIYQSLIEDTENSCSEVVF